MASSDPLDNRSGFSNHGSLINVAAPGGSGGKYRCDEENDPNLPINMQNQCVNIVSLFPTGEVEDPSGLEMYGVGDGYYRRRGTSMAAPAVAGLAALLRQLYPEDTWEDILWKISLGSDDVGIAGKDDDTGWGRINCYNSLFVEPQPALTMTNFEFSEIEGNGDKTVDVTETWGVTVSLKNHWRDAYSVAVRLTCDHPSISIIDSRFEIGDVIAGGEVSNTLPLTFKVTEPFSLDDYDPGLFLTISRNDGDDLSVSLPVTISQISIQLIHSEEFRVICSSGFVTDGLGNVYFK